MVNKAPVVIVVSGLGIAALGGALWWYQHRVEKAAQAAQAAASAKAPAAQQAPAGQPGGGKIPLTVFADEGVPMEAPRK